MERKEGTLVIAAWFWAPVTKWMQVLFWGYNKRIWVFLQKNALDLVNFTQISD